MLKNKLKRWRCSSVYSVSGWISLTECLRSYLVDFPFCYINLWLACWSSKASWRQWQDLCRLPWAVNKDVMLTFSVFNCTRSFTNLFVHIINLSSVLKEFFPCSDECTAGILQDFATVLCTLMPDRETSFRFMWNSVIFKRPVSFFFLSELCKNVEESQLGLSTWK